MVNKQWKNLAANVLSFISGGILVVLPFVIYFGFKGHEFDFWYGTLLYNIGYVGNSFTGINSCLDLLVFVKDYLPLILIIVLSLFITFKRGSQKRGLVWLLSSAISLFWFLRSRMSPAYAIVTLPYIYVFFVELKLCAFRSGKSQMSYKLVMGSAIILLLLCVSKEIFDLKRDFKEENPSYWSDRKLIELVPKCDRDTFVADDWSPQNYVYENIKPCYPFFTLQDFQTKMSPTLGNKVLYAFGTLKAKWILVSDYGHTMIKPILDKYYIKVSEAGGKILFKKKKV